MADKRDNRIRALEAEIELLGTNLAIASADMGKWFGRAQKAEAEVERLKDCGRNDIQWNEEPCLEVTYCQRHANELIALQIHIEQQLYQKINKAEMQKEHAALADARLAGLRILYDEQTLIVSSLKNALRSMGHQSGCHPSEDIHTHACNIARAVLDGLEVPRKVHCGDCKELLEFDDEVDWGAAILCRACSKKLNDTLPVPPFNGHRGDGCMHIALDPKTCCPEFKGECACTGDPVPS